MSNRDVEIGELVEAIEDVIEVATWDDMDPEQIMAIERLQGMVWRLVGPERESAQRLSSRHLRAGAEYCRHMALDLGIGPEVAIHAFKGEALKRVQKVAIWALEQAEREIEENGTIYGNRPRKIEEILMRWSRDNNTGTGYYSEPGVVYQLTGVER